MTASVRDGAASGFARLLAAALAGAGGLGLEGIVLGAAALSLGFSRAGALGLGAYVAGWAVGAFAAGRSRSAPGVVALGAGGGSLLLAAVVPRLLLGRSGDPGGELVAGTLALAGLFACGLPQGWFLPTLARGRRGVAALFAANLAGCVAGALWVGHDLVAAFGRLPAGLAAGALSALAGAVGWLALRGSAARSDRGGVNRAEPGLVDGDARYARLAPWIVGAVTLWTVGAEWILLRVAVLWVGSREAALAAVLAASLLALAAGAALLPPLLPRGPLGVLVAVVLGAWGTLWPAFAPALLEPWSAAGRGPLTLALVLTLPVLLPLGAIVPLVHRALGPVADAGPRLGRLLLHEAWGAVLAGPLVHWLLVPHLGLGLSLCLIAVPAAVAAGWALWGATTLACLPAVLVACTQDSSVLSRAAPAFNAASLEVVAFEEDAEFAVAVVDDGLLGERTLLTDTFRAAGDGRDYAYMRALGHLPVLLHPDPRSVAVLALGTGTTVGAVSLHPRVERIDVLEISPAVVRFAEHFEHINRGALSDPRTAVLVGDGRRTLANRPGRYDVVTIEPLLPDSPFGVYLYTEEFYSVAGAALAPGGLVCQWVPPHALDPLVFDAVLDAFRRSFAWSGAWVFGSQVVLLGGADPPRLGAEARGRFTGSEPLREALAQLGLDTPAGVAARFVAPGAAWRATPRRLTDADPWIVFRSKPEGAAVLRWLPENLGALASVRADDADWLAPDEGELREALGGLLAARIAQGEGEYDLVTGARSPGEVRAAVDGILLEVLPVAAADAEVRAFVEQLRYLRGVRDGVSRLRVGDARGAVEALTTAVELRGERADVHLYMAAALQALGLDAPAMTALEEALRRCPRLRSTRVWERALDLGLEPRAASPASAGS